MSKQRKAWAIVSPRGRIQIDTVSYTRKEAAFYMTQADENEGCKVRRVRVEVVRS